MKLSRYRFAAFWCMVLIGTGTAVYAQSRITYNHQQLFLNGSNIAWVNFADDLGPSPADTFAFRTVFDSIHTNGGNALRFWLHTSGTHTPAFDNNGKVVGPGTNTIANLKTILDMAWQRRIGLILCLWSFDMLSTTNDSTTLYRAKLMLTDTNAARAFINNSLIPMVNGVKAHPGIIAWEVFNEAEGMSNEFGWSTTNHVPMVDIQVFVNLVAGAIHRTDSTAKVTTGAWALTVQTDVNIPAKRADLATILSAMTADEKQRIEIAFAARYGFRVSAADIVARFLAVPNYNYYRDDRLIAVGGDPLGTLDFHTVHYYDWQGTAISPFHHPFSTWNLTKPLVIAEFWPEQTLTLPFTVLFETLYTNGYAGALTWGWYSGGSGHSQPVLQQNTITLVKELFGQHPEDIDPDPVSGKIYSFSDQPTLIDSGATSTLSWITSVGSSATINGNPVVRRGTLTVSPPTTTVYALIARGTIIDTTAVTVSVYPSGRLLSFTGYPTTIGQGEAATLKWRTTNGSHVFLNGVHVNQSDSAVVRPDTTTAYWLTTQGAVRETSSVSVTVIPALQINRALHKSIEVSSTSLSPSLSDPSKIVDGDVNTQWSTLGVDGQWVICDLGQSYLTQRVTIRWGLNYATAYRLKFSDDHNTWLLARTIATGAGQTEVLDSLNQGGRYVLLLLDTRMSQTSSGFIIRELEVYGVPQNPSSVKGEEGAIPDRFALLQNYPNPFNPSTTIRFGLPHRAHVILTLFNTLGQQVATLANGEIDAGYHEVTFDGSALPSGVYFYRIQAGDFSQTKKLLLLR